jgi:hypothetical protein
MERYASEKGRNRENKQMRYVSHTPAGAKVVPANDDGIHEINGWNFTTLDGNPTTLTPGPLSEAGQQEMT